MRQFELQLQLDIVGEHSRQLCRDCRYITGRLTDGGDSGRQSVRDRFAGSLAGNSFASCFAGGKPIGLEFSGKP